MASAQVLPNSTASSSRKQGHLEAGKRRLEEFRKKKAEGRAKKTVAAGQSPVAAVDSAEVSSQGAASNGTKSDGESIGRLEPSRLAVASGDTSTGSVQNIEVDLPNGLHSFTVRDELSYTQAWGGVKNKDSNLYRSLHFPELVNSSEDQRKDNSNETRNSDADLSSTKIYETLESVRTSSVADDDVNMTNASSTAEVKLDKYETSNDSESYSSLGSRTSLEKLGNGVRQYNMGNDSKPLNNSSFGANNGSMDYAGFNLKGRRISDSINHHLNIKSTGWRTPENSLMDHSSTSIGFYGSGSAKSRPSFLDSINISRVSSAASLPSGEPVKEDRSALHNANSVNGDMHHEPPPPPPPAKPNGVALAVIKHDNNTEDKVDHFPTEDENFASLEQHIEDLTQEKFSLQRALDNSKNLSESLASENSSLTESFNQQGKVINQLKSDMEKLQEEIRTQLLAFEALKEEYANAQLECTAADERAKILTSEVIGLEEKALRLRSNELKLEKQLETSHAEIASCKRKLSSLEKEHRDFESTIEALQEEKKLLQTKLRKASVNDITNDRNGTHEKVDASTSTMDLDDDREMNFLGIESSRSHSAELGTSSSTVLSEDASNFTLQYDSRDFSSDASCMIPDDQLKMIDNINSLISELAQEKEELVQALTAESSMTSKLKDLNRELSQKLEAQTQRSELLASQMANGNGQSRTLEAHQIIHEAGEYTDEGDEVVERVLGWIMKLFPGGPAKRRTSKLL